MNIFKKYEAPTGSRPGYLLPTLRRERNSSEAENSSTSSPSLRSWFSAKGGKFGIISLSILIIGLAVGLVLVQQQQNLQKKASQDLMNAFEVTDSQGNPLQCSDQGCETNSLEVRIKVKDLEALGE